MTAPVSLREALDALPDTAEGIAALFHSEGVRGYRAAACGCPLAVWLERQTRKRIRVALTCAYPFLDLDGLCRLPDGPAWFRQRFDDGEWPELVPE